MQQNPNVKGIVLLSANLPGFSEPVLCLYLLVYLYAM
jgi:hypothetical protein